MNLQTIVSHYKTRFLTRYGNTLSASNKVTSNGSTDSW
jgi:hypothetical protein